MSAFGGQKRTLIRSPLACRFYEYTPLASTACPAGSLALIEIGEALSASLRTLARVFGRAPRIAGPITFVPFTCVGCSDRSDRHCWNRQRCNCNGEHTTSVHANNSTSQPRHILCGVGRAELRLFGARPPTMVRSAVETAP